MKLFKTSKDPEPYQPSADWHRSGLHFFCRTFEFPTSKEQGSFLLEIIQIHDEKVALEATSKPGNQVEVALMSKSSHTPCETQLCLHVIEEIEKSYNEHN